MYIYICVCVFHSLNSMHMFFSGKRVRRFTVSICVSLCVKSSLTMNAFQSSTHNFNTWGSGLAFMHENKLLLMSYMKSWMVMETSQA